MINRPWRTVVMDSCGNMALKDNCLQISSEAVASKLYFDVLLGKGFVRFASDDINARLNYGYTILRSSFDRAIALSGYRSELGIHHHSR